MNVKMACHKRFGWYQTKSARQVRNIFAVNILFWYYSKMYRKYCCTCDIYEHSLNYSSLAIYFINWKLSLAGSKWRVEYRRCMWESNLSRHRPCGHKMCHDWKFDSRRGNYNFFFKSIWTSMSLFLEFLINYFDGWNNIAGWSLWSESHNRMHRS